VPDWRAVTRSIAERVGIPPDLFERQIGQESGFRPDAVSSAGARGIAQIVPEYHPSVDPMDPYAALTYAAKWMKELYGQYGNWRDALVAYNGGGRAVEHWKAGKPFEESVQYVNAILQYVNAILGPGKAEAAELDQPVPGGAPVASNLPPAPPELIEAERAKGPPTSIRIIDESVTDPGDPTGPKITNQNPTRRYFWASDNSHLDIKSVKPAGASPGSDEVDHYEVVGGNAVSKKPPGTAAAPARQTKIVTLPNGERIKRTFERDPQTGQWNGVAALDEVVPDKEPKKTNNKQVVTRNGKSYIYDPDTNTFAPAEGLPDEKPKVTTHTIGKRIYTTDENGNVVSSFDARTPTDVEAEGVALEGGRLGNQKTRQGLAEGELDIEKKKRDLLPKQQQVIQGHYDTIKYVQGMLERGEIEPSQADAYVTASRVAAEAALQGSTPFDIKKTEDDARRARQQMGIDILNQRIATTGSIGSSLLSAASSLAQRAMFRPGQTSLGFNPLAETTAFMDQTSRAAQADPITAALLAGAGPGGAPAPPAGLPPGAPSGLVPVPIAGASMPGAMR
jgi:hypothetical protein